MVTIPIQFCYNEYFLLQNVFWSEVLNEYYDASGHKEYNVYRKFAM